MFRITAAALLLSLMPAVPAFAENVSQDNIVVTPARIQERESEASSPVTVIRRDEIERTGLVFLDDLLRRYAVVQVLRDGAGGAGSRLILRGTDPAQSVILIDGVRVASAYDGYLDLSGITLDDVERIEISRGAHSVSYGSQAMGGVVNIITGRGGGESKAGFSYAQGGNGLENPSVTLSGGKKYRYRLTASAPEAEGRSSIQNGTEPDGYELRAYSGHMSMPLGKGGIFEVSGMRSLMERSLDRGPELIPYGLADDNDLSEERERELFMTRFTYAPPGPTVHTVTVSEWEERAEMDDPTYSFFNTTTSTLEGVAPYRREVLTSTRAYEYQASMYEEEGGVGIIGFERREETATLIINSGGPGGPGFKNTVAVNAAFVNLKMEDGPYTFVFGARRTEHEVSGDHVTYRVSAFQHDEGSTLRYRAAWATALRLPTALELELSASSAVTPELSESWEAGFQKLFGKGSAFGVMYFEQELTDLIILDPLSGLPANSGSASIRGVEAVMQGGGKVPWSISYTWLDAEDPVTGAPLPLRPEDRYDLMLGYRGDSLGLRLDYSHVGSRPLDVQGRELGSYSLLNIGANYRIGSTFKIFGRADNVLDEEYEDSAGHNAAGREYYAGLKASF